MDALLSVLWYSATPVWVSVMAQQDLQSNEGLLPVHPAMPQPLWCRQAWIWFEGFRSWFLLVFRQVLETLKFRGLESSARLAPEPFEVPTTRECPFLKLQGSRPCFLGTLEGGGHGRQRRSQLKHMQILQCGHDHVWACRVGYHVNSPQRFSDCHRQCMLRFSCATVLQKPHDGCFLRLLLVFA